MSDSKSLSHSNKRFLCFNLGKEEFSIPLLSVKEVIAMPDITPVPQTPSYFLGIMNLRGQVISILDLRQKLGIKSSETAETAVIICDLQPNSIGVVVDSINSVISPSNDQISSKPDLSQSKTSEYIEAVFRDKDRLILQLDISKTLTGKDHQVIAAGAKKAA